MKMYDYVDQLAKSARCETPNFGIWTVMARECGSFGIKASIHPSIKRIYTLASTKIMARHFDLHAKSFV